MKKIFKLKIATLFLIIVTIINMVALSTVAKPREEMKIVLLTGIATNPFYVTMDAGAKTAALELGVNYEYQGCTVWSFVEQMTLLRSIISRGVDGILISPCDSDAAIAPLAEVMEGGVPIICVDTGLSENDIPGLPLTFITSDNIKGGKIAGERLANIIGGKGKVALMRSSIQDSTDRERAQGFKEALSGYPEIRIIAEEFCEEQTTTAASQIETIISAHPDLAGAFGITTPTAHGVAMGIQAMGKTGEIKLVCFDAQPMEVQDIKEGLADSLIAQAPYMMGYLGVQLMVNYLEGFVESYCPLILAGLKVITIDNVDNPETQAWIYREEFLKP